MKYCFVDKRFSVESLTIIQQANEILDEYQRQGYRLSLRQLYYQFVARGLRENSERSYKNLGNLISDARDAGLIDWNMIEDRGRDTITPPHWNSPRDILEACAHSFRIDKWEDQPWHIEIMVEKAALEGVLSPVCRDLDVRFTANRGYGSSTLLYDIGRRIHNKIDEGKQVLVVYAGDHDPSGIDMTRDVDDRLHLYSEEENGRIKVVRIALNYDQVQRWNPPPNPAKLTDTRANGYIGKFGEISWELDAVRPEDLAGLVRDIVIQHRDDELWQEKVDQEADWRQEMREIADQY